MGLNSVIKRLDQVYKSVEYYRDNDSAPYASDVYDNRSTLATIVKRVLEDFSKETNYTSIFPNNLYRDNRYPVPFNTNVKIDETLYCIADAKAHALGLKEEQDINKIKEENESLKIQINDLKRGHGIYCSLIGESCTKIFESENLCFVIYDYNLKDYDIYASNAIKNSECGLDPVISKHLNKGESMGMYCTKICKPIRSSKICIADVTKDNSNVGLEIGLAWRYGKPLILTMNKTGRKEPPSDLAAFTRVDYVDLNELEEKLKDQIIAQLKRKN